MTDTRLKILLGFLLLLIMAGLSVVIALGNVQKENSFGLEIILGGLVFMSGAWSQWALNSKSDSSDLEKK